MVHRKKDLDRAQRLHDQSVDPDSPSRDEDLIVYARREDASFLWKMSWYAQKYLVLWAPLVFVATSLGFGVISPARKADELRIRVDTAAAMLQRQIDGIKAEQAAIRMSMDTNSRGTTLLIRMACISRTVSNDNKQLIGLIDARGECIR